uniref:alkylphosphonate utilization protein n=2 Tax=Yoonia sp. 208BN28-4 TaxID=3126505 RepID=UPI0030EDA655
MMRWDELMDRAGGVCEFCGASEGLKAVDVTDQDQALLCSVCRGGGEAEAAHWRCLEGAAWSAEPGVQIAVWRKLGEIDAAWAVETRANMMMEPDVLARAEGQAEVVHLDAHGMPLAHGDTVVLVKDLVVKGAGFTAKRGTAVRGISLVLDNAAHIEGKVEGQRIVILTEFVKRK